MPPCSICKGEQLQPCDEVDTILYSTLNETMRDSETCSSSPCEVNSEAENTTDPDGVGSTSSILSSSSNSTNEQKSCSLPLQEKFYAEMETQTCLQDSTTTSSVLDSSSNEQKSCLLPPQQKFYADMETQTCLPDSTTTSSILDSSSNEQKSCLLPLQKHEEKLYAEMETQTCLQDSALSEEDIDGNKGLSMNKNSLSKESSRALKDELRLSEKKVNFT